MGVGAPWIATDGQNVYWIGTSAIMRVPAAGGPATKVADYSLGLSITAISVSNVGSGLLVDDTSVYWLSTNSLGIGVGVFKAPE